MKYILTIIILAFICHTSFYSQQNFKGLKLKVTDLKTIKKNGKTSWSVKTTLTNHTKDTVFYVNAAGCETAYYSVGAELDSIHLVMDYKQCDMSQETIMALAPSAQIIVNLEFGSQKPITSSFKFRVYLLTGRLKNRSEHITFYEAIQKKETIMLVVSNRVKAKIPVADNK